MVSHRRANRNFGLLSLAWHCVKLSRRWQRDRHSQKVDLMIWFGKNARELSAAPGVDQGSLDGLESEATEMHRRVAERDRRWREGLPPLSERLAAMALSAARNEEAGRHRAGPRAAAGSLATPERPPVPGWRAHLYSHEAVEYLGLGELKRPENALNRLMKQGVLTRRKLGGRLIFSRDELDRVLAEGRSIRTGRRGRPKGSRNKRYRNSG